MIPTSQEYQGAVVESERSSSAIISFGVFDVTAKQDATCQATNSQPFTHPQQLVDDLDFSGINAGTFEDDYFKLNGRFSLMPDDVNVNDHLGWWSQVMSGADGIFAPAPVITIAFTELHSTIGYGLIFGEYAPCADFDVTWYNDQNVIGYELVESNTDDRYFSNNPVENFDKVVIRLLKSDKPYRYARILEFQFGLEERFDSDSIVSASVIEEVDPSGAALSVNKLQFTVLNENQRFNMLNPEGVYAFLQRRQPLVAKSGLLLPDGAYEYVPMGTYYLSDWKNATGLTATLEATDIVGLMDKTTYYASPFWDDAAFETILAHILLDTGSIPFRILSPELATEQLSGYIPISSHRSALQSLFLAARATLRVGRDGILEAIRPDYSQPEATVNNDTIVGQPTIEQKPLVTAVDAKEFSYALSTVAETIHQSTFTLNGQSTLVIPYDAASADVQLVVTGDGSVVGTPKYSATSATVTISGTGELTLTVTGKKYLESSRVVRASIPVLPAGEVPQVATVAENKLLTHNAQAVAQHLLDYYQKRIKQAFSCWANPALQSGDCIEVETMFGGNKSGVLEQQEVTFAPHLKGRLVVTG